MKNIFDKVEIIDENNISLLGMTDDFFCVYLAKKFDNDSKSIVVMTSTLYEANKLFNILQNLTTNVFLFPMDDFISSYSIAASPELKVTRLETINSILNSNKSILIIHLNSLLHKLPKREDYNRKIIKLSVGQTYKRDELVEHLELCNYERQTLVGKTGDYGVRGYIIDIFPIQNEYPVRIEFFGDQIESIRTFDVNTQKSVDITKELVIYPNSEFSNNNVDNLNESILDYLPSYDFYIKDFEQIKASYSNLLEQVWEYKERKQIPQDKDLIFNLYDILPTQVIYYETINNYSSGKSYKYDVKKIENFGGNFEKINTSLHGWLCERKTIFICINKANQQKILDRITEPYNIIDGNQISESSVNVIDVNLLNGFEYSNTIYLSEYDLFNMKAPVEYKTKFKHSSKIKDYNSLKIGDYVVHNKYGIGVYNGLKTLLKNDLKKDYIEVLYAGKDKLYIPVEKIDVISKYTGREGTAPKIYRLDSVEWEKTKRRIQGKVKEIADKLIKLYATREMQKGFAFCDDDEMQVMFEQEFEHNLTQDQITAVQQIKKDMENIKPMDRLLCGDVGYGKTEVAFEAMFKAVLNSKQVFYLCPTTILSKQQYTNAMNRFKHYPVSIAVLNRFTSSKETKRILDGVSSGKIDILFGTHRILSSDVIPKDLGLLVIDEEQRFGVMHKEKIKELKNNVDVLSLTATPIPRTLQMSLAGIRSLSLIETPPINRYPVETYVIEEEDLIIRDVIYKEMSRNGQVYFLYNKIKNIEEKATKLARLVPEARIVVAHGQMTKTQLENIMEDFVNKKYDILLCTTIIETGIDISNVNTLIVIDADKFGLSQLYQIRGRVGRTDKIAYAYLMYRKEKTLTETAIKRLDVIKQFTELGSGFAIASRDLAIRGAGDILGNEQAGFIDNIGIDLYLKILNVEIARLKGEPVTEKVEYEQPLLEVETHIDDGYVSDTELKLEIHRIINEIDSYEKLCEVKDILEDRFGQLSYTMTIYMYEEWFEKLAHQLRIINVKPGKHVIEMTFAEDISAEIDAEELFYEAFKITPNFRFKSKGKCIVIELGLDNLEKHYLYYLIDLLLTIKFKKS